MEEKLHKRKLPKEGELVLIETVLWGPVFGIVPRQNLGTNAQRLCYSISPSVELNARNSFGIEYFISRKPTFNEWRIITKKQFLEQCPPEAWLLAHPKFLRCWNKYHGGADEKDGSAACQ